MNYDNMDSTMRSELMDTLNTAKGNSEGAVTGRDVHGGGSGNNATPGQSRTGTRIDIASTHIVNTKMKLTHY